jgi:hypothetical protein
MRLSHHTLFTTAQPITVVPPPVLRFSSVGPDKAVYQKSGNLVTGMTVSTGQTFTANNTITTELDPAHNNAEVLVCGYSAWMEQNGLLPAEMYDNGARDFLAVVMAPSGINRDLFGFGSGDYNTGQIFDVTSLPLRTEPNVQGVGIHMLGNQGTLPNIPSRSGYLELRVTADPAGGSGSKPGLLTMADGLSSNSFQVSALTTGSTQPALRRGLCMGMGTLAGGLGYEGTVRFLYLDVFNVVLTPAERAQHIAAVRLLLNL